MSSISTMMLCIRPSIVHEKDGYIFMNLDEQLRALLPISKAGISAMSFLRRKQNCDNVLDFLVEAQLICDEAYQLQIKGSLFGRFAFVYATNAYNLASMKNSKCFVELLDLAKRRLQLAKQKIETDMQEINSLSTSLEKINITP